VRPLKRLVRIVGALAIVAASFVATLWLLDSKPGTCPPGRVIALNPPFARFSNSDIAYFKELRGLDVPADASEAPARSPLALCEDGDLIGTPHSLHADIMKTGRGRYSHWGNSMIFSTSDNTNPNANGRTYVAVQPR
jgi:hypothetical protein